MQELIYRERLQTKAIAYYRTLVHLSITQLKEEASGRMPPMAPDLVTGKEYAKPVKKLTDMSPGEVYEELLVKTKQAKESAMEFGGNAITTIQGKSI